MKYKIDKAWVLRNRANFVTWVRIGLCAFLLWPIICHREWLETVILPVMMVAALTDKLDGWVAKKYKIGSEFGGNLDRAADKCFLLDAFVFFLLDWRVHVLSKVFTVLLAVIEMVLTYYLMAGWIRKLDVSTVKPKKGFGYGQVKMTLLCIAIILQQLSIIAVGPKYHDVADILVGLMLIAGGVYAVLSLRGHRARHLARLSQPSQVPVV